MASDPILRAEGVSKRFHIRQADMAARYTSLRDIVTEKATAFLKRQSSKALPTDMHEDFWALRDVSFEIKRGEVVGVIGRNGAGKSTLLKILSRIMEPTGGRVTLEARVASLLEVGTGFHPELTGRENVFLNGAILGMSRAEIRAKFDRIVEFAEVARFIDTPVKRYSSGMYVRLAFAVAAHLEPEILIVDEVLSVGDAEFQKKCLGAMSDVAHRSGRTILFVSHNMRAVQDLCHSALLMEGGRVAFRGGVSQAVTRYLASGEAADEWRPAQSDPSRPFQFTRVAVSSPDGGEPQYDEDIVFKFDYSVAAELPPNRIVFNIRNAEGVIILTSAETDCAPAEIRRYGLGEYTATVAAPARLLAPGKYFLSVSEPLQSGESEIYENVLSFVIGERGSPTLRGYRPGLITPTLQWHTRARGA